MTDSEPHGVKGQCFCGGVQFEVTTPAVAACFCHCSICQRQYGQHVSKPSQFVTRATCCACDVKGLDLLSDFTSLGAATLTWVSTAKRVPCVWLGTVGGWAVVCLSVSGDEWMCACVCVCVCVGGGGGG